MCFLCTVTWALAVDGWFTKQVAFRTVCAIWFAFAAQVSVESPEVLVPLLSGITNAWIWTIDRRLGLFSGATVLAAATAAAAPAAAAHAEGRGDVVDMLAEDHGAEDDPSHEDSMLQVCL